MPQQAYYLSRFSPFFMKRSRFSYLTAGLALLAHTCFSALSAEGAPDWSLKITGPWKVEGKFAKGKDISAAAYISDTHAVIASDETRTLQSILVHPGPQVLLPRSQITLLPGDGTELDIEGLAFSPTEKAYFATGSHALARKKKVVEATRSYVFKVPVSVAGDPYPERIERTSLRSALQADPVLGPYVDKDAAGNGVDIEGLAEVDGRLFFALRAPSLNGKSFILEVTVQQLFLKGGPTPKLIRHEMPYGEGIGARDIVALQEGGFLILTGPSGSDDEPAASAPGAFWFWPGPGSKPEKIGELSGVPPKAEAILLYAQTVKELKGILFFDGEKDGGPVGFRLQRHQP